MDELKQNGDCTAGKTEDTEPPEPETAKLGTEKKAELQAGEEKKLVGHEERKELPSAGGRGKELEERLMRLQAEFENYKKRAAKENERVREYAAADMILKLLPVVDEFGIAMAHAKQEGHAHGTRPEHGTRDEFRRGMELIYAKLADMLKKEGLEEMKALHESFDPYKHDAVRQGEGDEGKVVEVVRKGYMLNGKVLRHAKVVVGKGKERKGAGSGGPETGDRELETAKG